MIMISSIECSQDNIIRFIGQLKARYGLDISLHFSTGYSFHSESVAELSLLQCHTNPYCFYIKNTKAEHAKCLACQDEIRQLCKKEEHFIYTCHADVREYIYRIVIDGNVAAFLAASGYQNPQRHSQDSEWYETYLSDEEIPTELLDTLLTPLALMLSLFLKKHLQPSQDSIYPQILNYLELDHNVSLAQLCKHFGYSPSYISHMFRRQSGCTLKSYCNHLKIRDSKILLETTDLSVTEVALASGFNNISYFIRIFRNITKYTPSAWRKKHRQ